MRRFVFLSIALVLAACGGAVALGAGFVPAPSTSRLITSSQSTASMAITILSPESTTTTTTLLSPEFTRTTAPIHADLPEGTTLVAAAAGAVDVYAEPGAPVPVRTLDPKTIVGTTTALALVEGPNDGWARVMLPGRPNGSEGWIQTDGMSIYSVHGHVVVDLSDRTLSYYEGGEHVLSTTVAVGSRRNPTPTGTFFVTDNVTLSNPNSPWGPHALGLSARSDTITEFNGGDGIIAIHGTNVPGSIGNAVSLGCVRVPNDVITLLHELILVGTPVMITA